MFIRMLGLAVIILLPATAWALDPHEIENPAIWQKRAEQAEDLQERARECQKDANILSDIARIAMGWIWERDEVRSYAAESPITGYIPSHVIKYEERRIQHITTYAYEQLRLIRYDGANVEACHRTVDEALRRIDSIWIKYPEGGILRNVPDRLLYRDPSQSRVR